MLSLCSPFIGDFRDLDKHILHILVHRIIVTSLKYNEYYSRLKITKVPIMSKQTKNRTIDAKNMSIMTFFILQITTTKR